MNQVIGLHQKPDGEAVRLLKLTRRAIIASGSLASLGGVSSASAASVTDEGARTCVRWLRLNAKIQRLQARWTRLEAWLVKEHSWLQLSGPERRALPWAQELRDNDGGLDVLFEQRDALLAAVPAAGSPTLESIIAKLAVTERLIWPDDHPEAHALIAGSVQDLLALSQGDSTSYAKVWAAGAGGQNQGG
jgi:hypothetical protein